MSPEATKSNCLVLLSLFLLSQIGLQVVFVCCLFACFPTSEQMKERELR